MKTQLRKTSPLLLSAALAALLAGCGTSAEIKCLPNHPDNSPECENRSDAEGRVRSEEKAPEPDRTPEPAPDRTPDAPKPDKPEPSPAPSEKKEAVDDGFKFDGGSRYDAGNPAPQP